jgi:hypothetical protein
MCDVCLRFTFDDSLRTYDWQTMGGQTLSRGGVPKDQKVTLLVEAKSCFKNNLCFVLLKLKNDQYTYHYSCHFHNLTKELEFEKIYIYHETATRTGPGADQNRR